MLPSLCEAIADGGAPLSAKHPRSRAADVVERLLGRVEAAERAAIADAGAEIPARGYAP